jgi:DNA uptake protein ComE-like DNA-binding protein
VIWALGSLLSFGVAAPILFAVAGNQARKDAWVWWAIVYGVLSWGGIALAASTPSDSAVNTLSGGMILVGWIASSAHAFAVRKEYKRRASGDALDPLEAARDIVATRREAQRLVREEPAVARELGIGRPDVAGARSMGVVDMNHASAGALATLPGIDDRKAGEIVAAREEIDGFGSLEDCGGVLGLDAGLVEDLRPFVVFLPR